MRRLGPLAVVLVLGWSATAAAQSPYGDDDGAYGEEAPYFRDPTPEPPPPPVRPAEPASPYYLLPREPGPAAPLAPAPQAAPQQWLYNGPHAVNAQYGAGFCNVQGPHYHPYPPFDDHLFQEYQGGYYFLGDPADFGYSGSLYWFSGPHPIASGYGFGWCYITWPHRHLYAPFGSYYSMCGPYWCYGGPFDAWYWYYRPYYFGFYAGWYPRYYRGGTYYRSGVPASPGRFGAVRPGGRGVPGTVTGRPAGRPGGYARPRAPLPMHRGPVNLYHRLPADQIRTPSYPLRASPYTRLGPTGPQRFAPRAGPGRSYYGPRFGAPRGMAPRFGTPRGLAPRFGTPRGLAPRFGAPSRPSFSAPRGGRSFGGRRR